MNGRCATAARDRAPEQDLPGLQALGDVDFAVRPGEIVALVGQNGSGKSTLVKILAGVQDPDPGARVARCAAATHVIHQDLGLIPQLNTVENLDLGRRHGVGGRAADPAPRGGRARARAAARSSTRRSTSRCPVAQLTPAERTIVAIARALDGWERPEGLLILDEPTAALHSDEVGRLFTAVRRAAAPGAGVIFVSHRLDEVLDLADRVVVLRDGRLVADTPVADLDHAELVRLIVGAALEQAAPREPRDAGEAGAARPRPARAARVRDLDLDVRAGEVVGVSGILGSGPRARRRAAVRRAAARAAARWRSAASRSAAATPRAAIARGRRPTCPADRHADGAVMTMRVRENVTLPDLRRLRRRLGWLDAPRRAARSRRRGSSASRCGRPSPSGRSSSSAAATSRRSCWRSGCATTRACCCSTSRPRASTSAPRPPSTTLVHDAAARGAAVLMASSDTAELASVCDRVLVMRDGAASAERPRAATLTEERLVIEGLGLGHDRPRRPKP